MMTIWSGKKAPDHVLDTILEHTAENKIERDRLLWVFSLVCAPWDDKALKEGSKLLHDLTPQAHFWAGIIDFEHGSTMTRLHWIAAKHGSVA